MRPVEPPVHQPARASLGLGCAVALYGLLVWLPSTFFQGGEAPLALIGYIPSVANGVALVALAALARPRALEGSLAVGATAVLMLAGIAPWVIGAFCSAMPPLPVVVGGGIAAGAGVALLFARWLAALASVGEREAHGALVGAAFASAVINIATGLLPQEWSWIVALICVVAELGLLARSERAVPAISPMDATVSDVGGSREKPAGRARIRSASRILLPVLAAAAVLTFAAPLVNTVLMADALALPTRLVLSSSMNLAVAVLLLVVWFVPKRPPSVFAVLLGFTGVLFGAVVLVWVIGFHAAGLLLGLGSAAFFLVTYLVVESSLETARANAIEPVRTYGIVGGLVMLARVVADVVSAHLHNSGIADESKTLIAVFLLVYLLTCAAFLLYGAVARSKAQPSESGGAFGERPSAQMEATPTAPTAMPTSWDLLAQQCDRVSQAFDLSQREREVLSLIMQGRNVPAVATELVVSRNTVQTHVRHIYERFGVHSRQELVAFVNEFGSPDGAKGAPLKDHDGQ